MRCAPALAVVAVLCAAATAAAQQPAGTPPGAAPMPVPGAVPMAPPPGAAWPGYAPSTYGAPPGGPPGYYAQPYPQPYYYPPPAPVLPPATLPYLEGEPVPQGYQIKTRPVRSMVLAGAITFGLTYVGSVLSAASLIAADSSDNGGFAPLFAPIVGPFITIGTARASGAGALWLVLDGLGQITGATLLIYGLVSQEKVLKRAPLGALTHPDVIVGAGSTALRWRF